MIREAQIVFSFSYTLFLFQNQYKAQENLQTFLRVQILYLVMLQEHNYLLSLLLLMSQKLVVLREKLIFLLLYENLLKSYLNSKLFSLLFEDLPQKLHL